MRIFRNFGLLGLFFSLGCAQLHHVQVGEIDNRTSFVKQPFDIKVSETGINVQEIGAVSRALLRERAGERAQTLAGIVGLFQMGPRTGNPVYVKDYTKTLVRVLYEKCPSGRITGLTSIRETRKYPVVSGEIVKVTGYCLVPRERYKGEGA